MADDGHRQSFQQDSPIDDVDGNALPTYENLAETHGPNSRFGRWRGWVEKRAAERYLDDDPDARSRRRERGWGDSTASSDSPSSSLPIPADSLPPAYSPLSSSPPQKSTPSLSSSGQLLDPTHVSLFNFGSRFLPHAKSPIRTLLPIMRDQFLLIGTHEGLSMLQMQPQDQMIKGGVSNGLEDAVQRDLWHGESVHQLALLESSETQGDVPKGVVLALVGTDISEYNVEKESFRVVRMYNLASLASLASWASSEQSTQPLELQSPIKGNPQSLSRRHRAHVSLTKSFKALVIESSHHQESRPNVSPTKQSPIQRGDSRDSSDSQWDMIDDLPLRWATDFVPLASSTSKLANQSVAFFEMWRDDATEGHVMLAVATKSQILLYETPPQERAFRFVKEFYTPLPARKVTFVYQRVADAAATETIGFRRVSAPGTIDNTSKLCLFVIFEKKAGIIRLSDSAVGEVELYDEMYFGRESSLHTQFRRSLASVDSLGPPKGIWVPPVLVSLVNSLNTVPTTSQQPFNLKSFYLLTRGKITHVLPSPLPNPVNIVRPYMTITWEAQPERIIATVIHSVTGSPNLQLIAIGDVGVEVQELSLAFATKGKGKQPIDAAVRYLEPLGFENGFLCEGGAWDCVITSDNDLSRTNDFNHLGVYAWTRKGARDWRIFWLGRKPCVCHKQLPRNFFLSSPYSL